MVHESDSVLFEGVVVGDLVRLIFEPFNLVPPNAIHTTGTHTVVATCAEEI